MLSVADIPLAGIHVNGVICFVLWHGREYKAGHLLRSQSSAAYRFRERNRTLSAFESDRASFENEYMAEET